MNFMGNIMTDTGWFWWLGPNTSPRLCGPSGISTTGWETYELKKSPENSLGIHSKDDWVSIDADGTIMIKVGENRRTL